MARLLIGFPSSPSSALARYSLAGLATVAALLLRWAIDPHIGYASPFSTLYAAIAFAALYCGVGPALMVTALGWFGVDIWFVVPKGTFSLKPLDVFVSMTYVMVSGLLVALGYSSRSRMAALKKKRQALAASEERLRVAQKSAYSGTWEWNFQTDEVLWSPEEEALYGVKPGTFSGNIDQWRRMVNPDDLANVDRLLQHAIDTHGDYHAEFRITRADGALRWIESFGQLFYDAAGHAQRIIGVNTDITKRKTIEEALRLSEARSRRLIDSNIIPVVCANMQRITEANDSFLEMIGYTRDELVAGQIDWMKMTPAEYLPKDMLSVEQLRARGHCTPFEKEYIRKDGSRVHFLIGATVLNAVPLEWMCFLVDLSELKRAEAELRKAHDEMEYKVEERTHQLAETVKALQSEIKVRETTEQQLRELSARLLRLQDEERRRVARDLHDSTGQTLSALKMTLASLEGLIAGIPNAPKLLTDLNVLADQALQEIRTTSHLLHPPLLDEVGFSSAAQWYVDGFAKRSGVQTKLELSPARLTKEAELVFFRVMQESLTNVLRHSGSTAVDIILTAESENAILSIRDYGKGMPSEKLNSFRETGAGVGVGLGGMKQRIRELGGHLRVESAKGGGTCVTATLPLAKVPQLTNASSQASPAA